MKAAASTALRQRFWKLAVALAAAVLMRPMAQAQQFPSRPVTIFVGFAPGAISDWMARYMAPLLQDKWKQSVIVENKPGAAGKIADAYVARAQPDGYTLLQATSVIGERRIFDKDALDAGRAFTGLPSMLYAPHVILVSADVPARTLPEYFAYAKAHPGKLNFATVINSGQMLDEYALFRMADVQMTIVPYNGGAAALRALIANEVQGYFGAVFGMQAQIDSGHIRALAVTGMQRYPTVPEIPTVKETTGLDFDAGTTYGFVMPAGAAHELATRISADMLEILKRPGTQDAIHKQGYEPRILDGEEFSRLIAVETHRAEETAHIFNIKAQ